MKKALYYAIRVATLYPYVVAVTSEKSGRYGRGRWYGRDVRHNESTNGVDRDIRGKFETQEEAEALRKKIGDLSNAYRERRSRVSDYGSLLGKLESRDMDALFRGEEPGPLPHVGVVKKKWIASSNAEWLGDGLRAGERASTAKNRQLREAAGNCAIPMEPASGGIIIVMPDETQEVLR